MTHTTHQQNLRWTKRWWLWFHFHLFKQRQLDRRQSQLSMSKEWSKARASVECEYGVTTDWELHIQLLHTVGQKSAQFFKVCKSCTWRHRKAFYITVSLVLCVSFALFTGPPCTVSTALTVYCAFDIDSLQRLTYYTFYHSIITSTLLPLTTYSCEKSNAHNVSVVTFSRKIKLLQR